MKEEASATISGCFEIEYMMKTTLSLTAAKSALVAPLNVEGGLVRPAELRLVDGNWTPPNLV